MYPLPSVQIAGPAAPVARWRHLAVVGLLAALAGPAASGAVACEDGDAAVVHVQQVVDLADDGTRRDVRTERTVAADDGARCPSPDGGGDGRTEGRVADLPVDVAVLHRDPADGAVEAASLADRDGPITTRVAVRDRTATEQRVRVDGPQGSGVVSERVAVPHQVRTTIRYPRGWSEVVPGTTGVRTDVRDGGLAVTDVALLFPPLTDDEHVLTVRARPGAGIPEVTVELTPIGPSTAALLEPDELDRDTGAVVAALAEASVDGAEQLASGSRDLADGLDTLSGGTGELASGLGEAVDGLGQLTDGAGDLAGGTRQLADGAGELAAGLPELGAGAGDLAEGNRTLAAGLREAADAADELADGNERAAEGNQRLADTFGPLGSSARLLGEAVDAVRDGLDLAGALPGDALDPAVGSLREVVDELDQLRVALGALAGGNAELAEANRQLADGNRQLAAALREAAAGADQLADGGEQLSAGARDAAAGAGQLAGGAGELASGAGQLAAGAREATDGIGEAARGADDLAAGADEAAGGAGQLADGAGELPGALDRARETADRGVERAAERDAVIDAGRDRAAAAVTAATGSPDGTLTTTLVAAGQDPAPRVVWAALAAVLLAAGATAAWWRRTGGAS